MNRPQYPSVRDFLNPHAGFSQEGVWKVDGTGEGVAIDIIFSRESVTMTVGDIAVGATGPEALCDASDVAGAKANVSVLTVGGDDWNVIGVDPDGTGWVSLKLSRDGV